MEIETEQIDAGRTLLRPVGRMDAESSPKVRQAILDQIAVGAQGIVVDLARVDFMDSSGLSALVSGMKSLRSSGGMLAICSANPQVHTALRLTMLDRVFPAHEDASQAWQYLAEHLAAHGG